MTRPHGSAQLVQSMEVLRVWTALSRLTGPAGTRNRSRSSVLVKLTADDGTTGWGETYDIAGSFATASGLATEVVGRDPVELLGRLRTGMHDAIGASMALSAVDTALHDLAGKLLGVPVHVLLGGARRDRVMAYASAFMYDDSPDLLVSWQQQAADFHARGFRAMKLRIGEGEPADELARIAALQVDYPDVAFMVDAWGAYPLTTALQVGRGLDRLGIVWFEEPSAPDADYAGHERLCAALDTPVAGGEMMRSPAEFRRVIERQALDVVQPDLVICGGMRAALLVAELATLYGIGCVPHSWNGGVMAAANLHLLAAIPSQTRLTSSSAGIYAEYDTTENPFMERVVVSPPRLVDGCFVVPAVPGLGVEVDEPALRSFAVETSALG